MKKSDYGILFLVALAFFILIATFQKVPGYMDAEYYFGQSIRIVQHHDLIEPFIWNFLNYPTEVNTPGFAFWLPMTSFLAAVGLWISSTTDYFTAKIFFILMAAAIVVMTAYLANEFLPGRRTGWLAGLLALFSGFYLPFMTTTDTFTPYMFFGGFFFICILNAKKRAGVSQKFNYWFLMVGIVSGLMTLTRSDGLIWLMGGWLGLLLTTKIQPKNWKNTTILAGEILLGFLIVMTPFYLRNYSIYKSIFPTGNGLMFWLTKYDDLFVYPSNVLTFSRWLQSGIITIFVDRFIALGNNLQTLVASGGTIVLAPIMLVGFWKTFKLDVVKLMIVLLAGIFFIMTIVFPYAGERGGFFHSLSAVQVVLWSLVPVGLDKIIVWGIKTRKWKNNRSWLMFGTALVVVVGVLSILNFNNKLMNGTESGIPWNETQSSFIAVDHEISNSQKDQTGIVMVNNPPGFTLATGRPSVMIPSGSEDALIDVGNRFNVKYLIINGERSNVEKKLEDDALLPDHFKYLFEVAENKIYEFKP